MNISECMNTDVKICSPQTSLREAAKTMQAADAGILPVGQDDKLVGMISDRDIAIRAVGAGLGPDTLVSEVMSPEIAYCYEDQDVNEVALNMGEIQVRRLPVLNRDKRLVGIVSLGDMARMDGADISAPLGSIASPSGLHSQ